MIRDMSVVGMFYPESAEEIKKYFEYFNKIYDERFDYQTLTTKAVIVPHAGYIYSGFTANIAYRVLKNQKIKNYIVIGPSHKIAFNGVSIGEYLEYDTPFGKLQSSVEIVDELKKKFNLVNIKEAHFEHSTEVQFPFIKYYLGDVNIVELVYSKIDAIELSEIIDFLLAKEDCGVIISTDLSHFHNLKDANDLDMICLDAVDKLDTDLLHKGCEACGFIGVEAMIISAKKLRLKYKILDYSTSADYSKDESRVVGYMSGCFYE